MRLREAAAGTAVMQIEVEAHHLSADGIVHGGVIASLLDSVCWYAIRTLSAREEPQLTAQINIHYIRPASANRLIGRATTIHSGRRSSIAEGEVTDEAGAVVARGSIVAIAVHA
jgi:acyl-CoA thioesterase